MSVMRVRQLSYETRKAGRAVATGTNDPGLVRRSGVYGKGYV